MKAEKGYIEFNSGIGISYWQNLTEIFKTKQFNWNTWQFINIEFENDRAMQGLEFTFVLLCCGISIRIPTHPTEEHKLHKEVCHSLKRLKQSCYGWVNSERYKFFRKKDAPMMLVHQKRNKDWAKKIFIQ